MLTACNELMTYLMDAIQIIRSQMSNKICDLAQRLIYELKKCMILCFVVLDSRVFLVLQWFLGFIPANPRFGSLFKNMGT